MTQPKHRGGSETEKQFTTNNSPPTLFLPHFPREGGGREGSLPGSPGRARAAIHVAGTAPSPLGQTQTNADSPPSSRSKLLKPALKWCLTGPGPPLSAGRLQAAPTAATTTTELHPGAGPNGRRTRCGRASKLRPSASPAGPPPPEGRVLTAAAPPRPHLPAPRVPSRPQRQQQQPLGSSQAHSGCAAAKKAPSYWPKRGRLPQQRRRRLALAGPQPPRRTRAMLTIRRRGAQPIEERAGNGGEGGAGGCARGAGGARAERVMPGGGGGEAARAFVLKATEAAREGWAATWRRAPGSS